MTGYWVLIDRSAYLGYSAVPVSIVYLCTWTAINLFSFNNILYFWQCFFPSLPNYSQRWLRSHCFIDYCFFKEFFALIFVLWLLKKVRIKIMHAEFCIINVCLSQHNIDFFFQGYHGTDKTLIVIFTGCNFFICPEVDCKERDEIFWI